MVNLTRWATGEGVWGAQPPSSPASHRIAVPTSSARQVREALGSPNLSFRGALPQEHSYCIGLDSKDALCCGSDTQPEPREASITARANCSQWDRGGPRRDQRGKPRGLGCSREDRDEARAGVDTGDEMHQTATALQPVDSSGESLCMAWPGPLLVSWAPQASPG